MGINSRTVLFSSAAIAAFGACMAGVPMAMATTTTIISDTFSSTQAASNSGYLQGTSPDVGPTGATWTTHYYGGTPPAYSTPTSAQAPFLVNPTTAPSFGDGAYIENAAGGNVDAALPFTPNGNGILSLTATLFWNNSEWIGMGFASSATTADPTAEAGPWTFINPNIVLNGKNGGTSDYVSNKISGRVNTVTFTYNPVTMMETVAVSNTSNGADYITGSASLASLGVTTPPTIGAIFFAIRGGSGTATNVAGGFANVTLTQGPEQAVPEPASWGLLALGGVAGLMLLRRRKLA
jgi:hypothetical protein